jgi:hypothetical protein
MDRRLDKISDIPEEFEVLYFYSDAAQSADVRAERTG